MDAAEVSKLYREHARRLLGYFVRQGLPRQEAADLVQEVFVNIVRHRDQFRGDAKFSTWMWSIARNVLVDHFRRARVDFDDEADLEALPAAESPSTDLRDCVQRAFTDFAASYRDRAETLALVAFEGWSVAEVADYLGRTPGAAREYLSQCRKKLQPFMERCREYLPDAAEVGT